MGAFNLSTSGNAIDSKNDGSTTTAVLIIFSGSFCGGSSTATAVCTGALINPCKYVCSSAVRWKYWLFKSSSGVTPLSANILSMRAVTGHLENPANSPLGLAGQIYKR